MALYAIGDLHLSLGTDKPMDVFGGNWENYVEKILSGFSGVSGEDVCVLCGDLTWSMTLEGSLNDFLFVHKLPGKKIILKGNHDYWWTTATKAQKFFDKNGFDTLRILNNNCHFYGDTAICGTRGWFYDGSARAAQDKKVMAREIGRLEASLKAAGDAPRKLCFLHYPPVFRNFRCQEMLDLMVQYGVTDCYYGHIHHSGGHRQAVTGLFEGINYHLASADFLNFIPCKALE